VCVCVCVREREREKEREREGSERVCASVNTPESSQQQVFPFSLIFFATLQKKQNTRPPYHSLLFHTKTLAALEAVKQKNGEREREKERVGAERGGDNP
jgi:hypothetical protein